METTIRFNVKCGFINPEGKKVVIKKLFLINARANDAFVRTAINEWAKGYINKGYTDFRVISCER